MAQKLLMEVRRLPYLGYGHTDMSGPNVSDAMALRGLAKWLDDHPYTTLLSISFNYGVDPGERYMVSILDAVEDEDIDP